MRRAVGVVVAVAVICIAGFAGYRYVSGLLSDKGQGYISEEQYVAVHVGDSQQSLAANFGPQITPGDIYVARPIPPSSTSCAFYQDDVPTIDGTIYRFCFKDGLVSFKDGWGPLFNSPPLGPSPSP